MIFILFIVIFISYGQIFQMGVWKDDNAIFFKLQHINETAGFFGKGLIGEGPYRFSFTPYWFIYKIFGQRNMFPYYLLIFIFYLIAAFAIYKFIEVFISKEAGRVSALLFACGYIASEGFFWLANAMVSDVSIILLCLCMFFYYKFFLKRKLRFYLLALLFYSATAYLTAIRSYYFIGIVILFELFIFAFEKKLKYLSISVIRLVPFLGVFYYFFIYGADARSGLVKDIVQSLLSGKFYIFYGFLTSLTNIVIPDTITAKLFEFEPQVIRFTSIGLPYVFMGTLSLFILGLTFMFIGRKYSKRTILIMSVMMVVWAIISNQIFNVPVINLNPTTNYATFFGGLILIFSIGIFIRMKGASKMKYLFLLFSFYLSIAAYWLYEPLVDINTTHRYLTGAFFVLVCLLAFIYVNTSKKVKLLIILWGLFNLYSAFIYQKGILDNRSYPVESFYTQLKSNLPVIKKGDLLYFDLSDSAARDHFENAISTASMPDETSFAWRYGVDRYDLKIVSSFDDFVKFAGNTDHMYSFFYNNDKLTDTTSQMRSLLSEASNFQNIDFSSNVVGGNLTIDLKSPIPSLTPVEINANLTAKLPDVSRLIFPYTQDSSLRSNVIANNPEKRIDAFRYQEAKSTLLRNMKVTTSSDWMGDVASNLTDGKIETNWRANRLLWGKENTNLVLDLGNIYKIGEFVWVNGFGNSTPTKYSVEISTDGKKWSNAKTVSSDARIDLKDPQIVSFEPQNLRYIRMNFYETLDSDSPQIAEIWTFPSEFDDLNIKDTEQFLANPFGYVPDVDSFNSTIQQLKYAGEVSITGSTSVKVYYDGFPRLYTFTIPAGGTTISELTMKNLQIPGGLIINGLSYKNLNLKEIQK